METDHFKQNRRKFFIGFAAVLACLLLSTAWQQAQVLYGTLLGRVEDPSGAVLVGTTIEVTNASTGIKRTGITDDTGSFAFRDLQPGSYELKVTQTGFKAYVKPGVMININSITREDVRMELGMASDTVTVTAGAAMLQTDRAEVSAQLERAQITQLPVTSGRNFQQLYKLIPGAAPPAEAHSDAGNPQRALTTYFNGVSHSNNNTRIDGATISYPWLPHIVAYVPPAEAVEMVNVVTNSFDAEQGLAAGAAVNVQIRSGTNDYHGSAHWYHTNSRWKARNFFYVGDKLPQNLFNQFGGTFGGPIIKNKLFFFGDWERTTRREYRSAYRTIAPDILRQGDFTGTGAVIYDPQTGNADGTNRQPFPNNKIPTNRIDPASAKMIALLPAPNLSGVTNNYFAQGSYEFNRDNMDFKVNYNPTEKATMFARYSFSPSLIFDPPSLGAAGGDALAGGQPGEATGRIQNVGIGGTYTISPTLLLDGNIGYTRLRLGAENVDIGKNYGLEVLSIPGTNGPDRLQGGYPRFTFTGFSSIGNPNVSNPFQFRDNQYVLGGNLGWVRGSHSFRFGAEYAYYTINHFQPQAAYGPRGGFAFSGGLSALRGGTSPNLYNSWADFLLGLPSGMGKDLQFINPTAVRMPSWGFFARDQWQVNRKLTLNFGVRYEYYPFATRDHIGGDRYDPDIDVVLLGNLGGVPTDTGADVGHGQLAPRFGIAYRLTEKTVVRIGYGISIDPQSYRYMRDAYPATISSQYSGASTYQAAGSLRNGLPSPVLPDISSGKIILPATVGTETFPVKFDRGYIQSFNLSLQREIGKNFTVQAAFVGARAIRQTARININAAQGIGVGNAGRALYSKGGKIGTINMTTPYNTANYNSLQTQVTRRLGSGSMLGLSYTFSKAINYADNSDSGLTWNWVDIRSRNRAVAGFDRPHNLQIFGVYELPFGKGKRWAAEGWAAYVFGGWQLNGVYSAVSGVPFTIGSSAASLNSPGNTQTADQVKAQVDKPKQVGRGTSWFDPYAFMPVTAVRFGNVGRNNMRGPGVSNLDASLFRDFQLVEKLKMQFRMEVFNVTNTPAFGNPGTDASAATRAADGTITNLNNYSSVTSAAATERQIRLALKLIF